LILSIRTPPVAQRGSIEPCPFRDQGIKLNIMIATGGLDEAAGVSF